jgi:hypothetical protein
MTFDVTKFLALTAVLAGAGIGAAACSSNGNDGEGENGGSGGSAGSSSGSNSGGDSGAAGSSAYAGQGNGLGGEGGALGGSGAGGAGQCAAGAPSQSCNDTGGASTGGAGAGGEGGAQSCLATDAAYEGDPCADIPDTKCDGAEEGFYNPFYDICAASGGSNTTVRVAFAECLEGDVCADTASAEAAACWSTLAAQACPVEGTAAACTTIVGTCSDGLTAAACTKMLNVYTEAIEFVPDCMDPNAEAYDELFVGDCKARLSACTGVPAF